MVLPRQHLHGTGGGMWAGRMWSPDLPTDGHLLLYLLAAFLDAPGWLYECKWEPSAAAQPAAAALAHPAPPTSLFGMVAPPAAPGFSPFGGTAAAPQAPATVMLPCVGRGSAGDGVVLGPPLYLGSLPPGAESRAAGTGGKRAGARGSADRVRFSAILGYRPDRPPGGAVLLCLINVQAQQLGVAAGAAGVAGLGLAGQGGGGGASVLAAPGANTMACVVAGGRLLALTGYNVRDLAVGAEVMRARESCASRKG
jgi:hypothetical protein